MLKDRCGINDKENKIVFRRGEDGLYPSLWGYSLNTKDASFTNSLVGHEWSRDLPDGRIHEDRFLCLPVLLGEDAVGQHERENGTVRGDFFDRIG